MLELHLLHPFLHLLSLIPLHLRHLLWCWFSYYLLWSLPRFAHFFYISNWFLQILSQADSLTIPKVSIIFSYVRDPFHTLHVWLWVLLLHLAALNFAFAIIQSVHWVLEFAFLYSLIKSLFANVKVLHLSIFDCSFGLLPLASYWTRWPFAELIHSVFW